MTSLLARTAANRPGTMSATLAEAWMRDIEAADAHDTAPRPAHEIARSIELAHRRKTRNRTKRALFHASKR